MTVRELLTHLEAFEPLLLGYLVAVPLLCVAVGWMHPPGEGGTRFTRYLYAVLVYLACIPGSLSAALLAYSLFIRHQDLLDVSLTLYVLPILSMLLSVGLMSRTVSFDEVPGFERLSGLLLMMVVSFLLVLFLERTRVWVVFGGSVMLLAALFFGALSLLRRGAEKAMGRRGPRG